MGMTVLGRNPNSIAGESFELVAKQKPPDHQGGGFTRPVKILFGKFLSPHIGRDFVPVQGTVVSTPGCQTHFGVIPDVA